MGSTGAAGAQRRGCTQFVDPGPSLLGHDGIVVKRGKVCVAAMFSPSATWLFEIAQGHDGVFDPFPLLRAQDRMQRFDEQVHGALSIGRQKQRLSRGSIANLLRKCRELRGEIQEPTPQTASRALAIRYRTSAAVNSARAGSSRHSCR